MYTPLQTKNFLYKYKKEKKMRSHTSIKKVSVCKKANKWLSLKVECPTTTKDEEMTNQLTVKMDKLNLLLF